VDHEVGDDLLAGLLDLLMNLLHEILKQELHVGFHHVELLLPSRVVVVLEDGHRVDISDTKC
jgi:hypothetical protein